ncbi:MAG TPA: hypothetical protein VFX30_07065, partial [bacterium]|nr:hypothetical protein [bacterium]
MKKTIKIFIAPALILLACVFLWPKLYGDIRDRRPVWSPDGRFLAFVSNRRQPGASLLSDDRPSHLWLIGADGKGLRPLTPRGGLSRPVAGWPLWSPDGGKLLVESGAGYWIVPVAGGEPKALDADVSSPRWSPDGQSLLYTSRKDSRIENIWTAAADGSAAKPLTRMTRPNTDCGGAEWSPDGSRIL